MTILKTCCRCHVEKPIAQFSKMATAKSGVRGYCKACGSAYTRKWSSENKGKKAESDRRYREQNAEALRAKKREYYVANKQKICAKTAKWKSENQERARASVSKWFQAHPEYKWRLKNPSGARAHEQNRRCRKRKAGGTLSLGLASRLYKLQRGKCACCFLPLRGNYHLDHIVPLALGGSNTDDNIQLLHPACNLSKHAKHPIEFMQSKGFLL